MFSSAFDEALARPLVSDEERQPSQKKWSWTSAVATVFTIDDMESDDDLSYEAPHEVVPLVVNDDDDDDDDEQAPLVVIHLNQDDNERDLESAVLSERHEHIRDITTSMKQIHDIQQDLANVVDSQDHDIKRMSCLAIEAFEETECGVQELQRASTAMQVLMGSRQRQRALMTAIAIGFMLVTFAWAFHDKQGGDHYNGGDHERGDPQKFP